MALTLNGKKYNALIADTRIKRVIGLMHRPFLGEGECMLFVFKRLGYHSLWMLNMHFSIDAVWLDEEMVVVDYAERMRPCSSIFRCRTYSPSRPALYVIEGNAGLVRRNRIRKGLRVKVRRRGKKGLSPSSPVHL